MAVKSPERKAGILCADFSLSIAQHSPGNIRKSDGNRIGNPGETFFPQGTASTPDLQNVHIFSDFTLLKQPGKPSLFVFGIKTVKMNSGRNIAGILILAFHTFFHISKMNQIQHMTPVDRMVAADFFCGILYGFFHHLKLFYTVFNQLLLQIQRVQHKMIIRIVNGHFFNIIKRKSQIF